MTLDPDAVRRTLMARRHQLLARYLGAIDRVNEELDSREIEAVENATEQWDARLLSAMSDTDARALDGVVGALRRLDDGTYGICASCGERIDPARLQALPEAAHCVACAEERESPTAPVMPMP
jgi:DnaK suppressor protein